MPVELIVGAAVGVAAASSGVRKVVRKGVVYGLAGGLIAYDKVTAFASGIATGVREGVSKIREPNAETAPAASAKAAENGAAPAEPRSPQAAGTT